jgi:dipeptidase D
VLAALRGAGVEPAGQVMAVIGFGEENDWEGMQRYAGTARPTAVTLSIDGSFPVVVGEAGFVAFGLSLPNAAVARPRKAVALSVEGGEFLTQVPGRARLILAPAPGESPAQLEQRVKTAIRAELTARDPASGKPSGFDLGATLDAVSGHVTVEATGLAIHASLADEGHNALWPLSTLARRLRLERNGPSRMLELVARELDGDHYGAKLGVAYAHPFMGKLLVTPDVLRTTPERVTLAINMRRPAGLSSAEFSARLDAALARLKREVDAQLSEEGERYVGEAMLVPPDSALVRTLLEVYRAETGDAASAPITLRGGTYAKLFPGALSFGPVFPAGTSTAHMPDEWIAVEDLNKLTRMLVSATERLALPQVSGKAP